VNRRSVGGLAIAAVAALLLYVPPALTAQSQDKAEAALKAAMDKEVVDGNLKAAIEQYKKLAEGANKPVAARALVRLGGCYEKQGNADARKTYEQVLSKFGDQKDAVAEARARLAALGGVGAGGALAARRILADASGVYGVLTADGKYIRRMDYGTGDVVQFEVASGQRSRITNKGPFEHYVEAYVFSRDGKQIVYDRLTKDGAPELRIRNLDGSGLRTLYSESATQPFDWSPDAGSILALRERNKAIELTLISTADGSVRVLRSTASAWYMLTSASFSPDGRFVAFSLVREGSPPNGDVFLMTADGRNEVVVAGHPAEDRLLAWTPDGRSLLFLSDRSGTWDIWTVHITGGKQQGEPELLKKDFGYGAKVLGFAPDGSCYYRNVTRLGGLYEGAVDLETGKVLVPPAPVTTRYTGPPSLPTWSPDGNSLLYAAWRGKNILTIRSTATGEERFLSPRLREIYDISWAPDGHSVLAYGMTEREGGVFRIDAETSETTKLAGAFRAPMLCPDGKTLVFMGEGAFSGGGEIRKRNLDTGEESVVVKRGAIGGYGFSPDGRQLVFQVDGAVKTVSLNGGEPRELFRGLAQYYWLKWTTDGRYIVAQALAAAAATSEIWRVPAQGGTPLKLDLSVPKMELFALHPDNRRFACSVNEGSKSELWVLENFLPTAKAAK